MGSFHKDLTDAEIHIIYAFTYADSTEREADTSLEAGDIGKIARQTNNNTYWILLNNVGPVWQTFSGGGNTFAGLTDTPDVYSGAAGQSAIVNGTEDGLVFEPPAVSFLDLTDTPSDYTSSSGHVTVVNGAGDGLVFSDDITIEAVNRAKTTGILSGGVLTVISTTTVRVAAGTGQVMDMTDPINPVFTPVSWIQTDYVATTTGDDGNSLILVDSTGTISDIRTVNSDENTYRDFIIVGTFSIFTGLIFFADSRPFNIGYQAQGFEDFSRDVIGPATVSGLIFSENDSDLSIAFTSGTVFDPAANFQTDANSPNLADVTGVAGPPVFMAIHDGANLLPFAAPSTQLVVTEIDNGDGTTTTIGINDWSVIRIYYSPTSIIAAMGQVEYNTFSEAEGGIASEDFFEAGALPTAWLRSFLVVRQDATDLGDITKAVFFEATKFRISGAAGGAGGAGSTPGGVIESVQYNDGGVFGGDNNLKWDKATPQLEITGQLVITDTINDVFVEGDLGAENIYVGDSLPSTIGEDNAVFGFGSMDTVDGSTTKNIAIGNNVAPTLSNSNRNTLVGHDILEGVTGNTIRNVVVGHITASSLLGCFDNIIIGDSSATSVSTFTDNVILGNSSTTSATFIERSVILGNDTAATTTAVDTCIVIGHGATTPGGTVINYMNIGGTIFADTDNQFVHIGSTSSKPAGPETLRVEGDTVIDGDLAIEGFLRQIKFDNTPGGDESGISYLDTGSVFRKALYFGTDDTVILANNASDGIVQIRANTATPGGAGEAIVAIFEDDLISLEQATEIDATLDVTGDVKIGGTSFTEKFSVEGNGKFNRGSQNTVLIRLDGTRTSIEYTGNGKINQIGSFELNAFRIVTNSTDRIIIDAVGNVEVVSGDLDITLGDLNIVAGALNGIIFDSDTTDDNISIGDALAGTLTGIDGIYIGYGTAGSLTAANNNVIIGHTSFNNATNAVNSVIVGESSGLGITAGDNNVIIGQDAGNDTLVANNILIGKGTETLNSLTSNCICIGDTIWGDITNAQVRVGGLEANALTADASLELFEVNRAFLANRLTTTLRDGLTAVNGMLIYNTTTNQFEGYENGSWVDL